MRIRIRFSKNISVKYLGHLDIMRAFQKCMNRAGIRMQYSEGFNPHQKMSFALPLGVGILSRAEYMDAEVADGQDPAEIRKALEEVSGTGFDILNVRILKENAEKAMATVRYADFEAETEEELFSAEDISAFMDQPTILCEKKTKKGEKTEDIRPMIVSLSAGSRKLRMRLLAGSEGNLKAETLLKALYAFKQLPYDRDRLTITRTELMGKNFVPLESLGTVS